jgi:hypothetical protein
MKISIAFQVGCGYRVGMMNMDDRGVYGPDDVSWAVQEARDNASDDLYRKHKEKIDAQDRLAIKRDLLARHEQDGIIYQDSDNQLYIGFERNGNVYTFAFVNIAAGFIHFTPLAKAVRAMVRWAPISQIKPSTFKMVAPKGCI